MSWTTWSAAYGADHVVQLIGDVEQAEVGGDVHGLDAGDLVLADLDGVDLALEGLHGVEPQVAQGPFVAHHGHRAGVEGALQLLAEGGHGPALVESKSS